MSAVEMSRADAVALVQRILDADYASDDEVDGWLDSLDTGVPVRHLTAPRRPRLGRPPARR
ncbi:hypothetical protein GCM10010340_06550 [Streptomyces griseoloalbus]|nr:hypothetical protein GCM10010340_06550 [Streptomyces albaduncus]